MRNLAFLLVCLIGLGGCLEDAPPIRSGTVAYDSVHSATFAAPGVGPTLQSRALSASQLQALDQWLHSHRLGWGLLFASPPRPSISVAVVHDDGTKSELGIILKWYTAAKPVQLLVLRRRDHNEKVLDVAIRYLSNEEIADLEGILAVGE
jgi:hypothetical protein